MLKNKKQINITKNCYRNVEICNNSYYFVINYIDNLLLFEKINKSVQEIDLNSYNKYCNEDSVNYKNNIYCKNLKNQLNYLNIPELNPSDIMKEYYLKKNNKNKSI